MEIGSDMNDNSEKIISRWPAELRLLAADAPVTDVSGRSGARTYFIDRDGGYYLKIARKGSLLPAFRAGGFLAQKKLAARVIRYISADLDYLLTEKLAGEPAADGRYLAQPERLAKLWGQELYRFHQTDTANAPAGPMTPRLLELVGRNYAAGNIDTRVLAGTGVQSADDAYAEIMQKRHLIEDGTLLHGDYCLPNMILKDFRFSGFVDVAELAIGDRHYDLFWGKWSLEHNLGTDRYTDIYFESYGKQWVDPERVRLFGLIGTLDSEDIYASV